MGAPRGGPATSLSFSTGVKIWPVVSSALGERNGMSVGRPAKGEGGGGQQGGWARHGTARLDCPESFLHKQVHCDALPAEGARHATPSQAGRRELPGAPPMRPASVDAGAALSVTKWQRANTTTGQTSLGCFYTGISGPGEEGKE